MEELMIPRHELAYIHNALRLAANRLGSHEKKGAIETALDRTIKKAMTFSDDRLKKIN